MVNADLKKKKKQKHIGLVCPDEPAWLKGNAQQAELKGKSQPNVFKGTHIHIRTHTSKSTVHYL